MELICWAAKMEETKNSSRNSKGARILKYCISIEKQHYGDYKWGLCLPQCHTKQMHTNPSGSPRGWRVGEMLWSFHTASFDLLFYKRESCPFAVQWALTTWAATEWQGCFIWWAAKCSSNLAKNTCTNKLYIQKAINTFFETSHN